LDSGAPAPGGTGRGGETLTGDSTVESVVVVVDVPASVNYALDPLDLDSTAGQVQQVDLYTVNKTKAPVLVTVDVEATAAADVTLVTDPDELDQKNRSADVAKDIYFGLLGASDVTASTLAYSTIPGDAEFTYDKSEEGTLTAFGSDGKASIEFSLGAATDSALANGDAGVASYTFYAELNTYADWKAGDLDVTADYTFIALKESDVPDSANIAGLNVVKSASTPNAPTTPTTAGFYTPGSTSTTAAANIPVTFPNSAPVTIDFWFNGATSGAVVTGWQSNAPSSGVLAAVHFNYSANTITVDAGVISTAARTLTFTFDGTTYTAALGV
jgi:hypothetical protein